MQVEINETIPEGKKRFRWPWDLLEEVGEFFVVKEPVNVKNGRQSVHQKNLKLGQKVFVGSKVKEGGFKVERVM